MGISIFVLFSVTMYVTKEEERISANTSSTPTFSAYEKVKLGSQTFTLISADPTSIKLLSDTASETGIPWNEAQTSLETYSQSFGTIGSPILMDRISQPTSADLTTHLSGSVLNSSIPLISSNWWLGDASLDNRSKYMTAANKNDGSNVVKESLINNDGTCAIEEKTETGILPTTDYVSEKKTKTTITKGNVYVSRVNGPSEKTKGVFYRDSACTLRNTSVANESMDPGGEYRLTYRIGGGYTNAMGEYAFGFSPNGGVVQVGVPLWLILDQQGWSPSVVGEEASVYVDPGVCYEVQNQQYQPNYGGSGNYEKYMKINSIEGLPATITYKVTKTENVEGETFECPGQSNTAGKASVRPMVTLTDNMIAFANKEKRTMSPSSILGGTYPTSDTGNNKPHLTLYAPNFTVGLDDSHPDVKGDIMETVRPENGVVSIPVKMSGDSEGSKYVSATASIDGAQKYGVLKQVSGSTDKVLVDLAQFSDDPSTLESISLTLYQEDSGAYDTAYIGDGTGITVKFKNSQVIDFDAGIASTVTYGDRVDIPSSLTTEPNKQANTNITYTIKSGDATIESQTYDKATGKATAKIKATNGTGKVVVSIKKLGDDTSLEAEEKTVELTLAKKDITVHPVKPTKSYTIGDPMPTISSTSSDLVTGDTIPSEIVVKFSPIDGTIASKPASGATIDASGTWKITYDNAILTALPKAFSDKYNVTLFDYDDDTIYTFSAANISIPDAWISITPDPNEKGWNKTDVTIKPIGEAITKGYTTIALYDDTDAVLKSGTSIIYNEETDGATPIITLQKGAEESAKKTLREIKIDKTNPTLSSAIDKEDEWIKADKKVTLTTMDALSGIEEVTVTKDGATYTATKEDDTTYSFMADSNGDYEVTISDVAGNETTETISVAKIDKTVLTLQATLQPFDTSDHRTQNIALTKKVGESGVKSYKVYFKKQASDDYMELADLDTTTDSITYVAKMNGYFKFELIDNTDAKISDEVEVSEVTPPIPSTKITAVLKDGKSTAYVNNTWTNQDVTLTLSNVNTEVSDPVTWKVQVEGSTTWEAVSGNTYEVSTSSWLNKRYSFKATTSTGVEETVETGIRVKIDKEKPIMPTISEESKYTSDKVFGEDETVQANKRDKPSTIPQTIYYKDGASGTWKTTIADAITMKTNGEHNLYFKVVDEAGNESDVKGPIYVNINKEVPTISFTLNKDPMNEWLNSITLGYFFKETVQVDILVDCEAEVYYIVDSSDTPSLPLSSDARWMKGTSTKILPDAKAVIYAKAVNKANKEVIDSTIYHVYADATNPNIQVPEANLNWTNENEFEITVNDALSGIDTKTLKYSTKEVSNATLVLTDGKTTLTLVDGDYEVRVQGKDNSGNAASSTTRVKIDTVNPILSNIQPDSLDWADSRIVRFKANDALSGLASGYPKVTNSKGNVAVIKDGNNLYHFVTNSNDTYTIDVQDQAGNKVSEEYVENKIGTDQSVLRITAESGGKAVSSNSWVKADLTFTISGGYLGNAVTSYQVAMTSGSLPEESDWNDISDPDNKKHVVSEEQKGSSYWFRSLPDKVTTHEAFVVNLDKTAPTNLAIELTAVNRNAFAYMINALSFGEWMKEAQKATFSATDNLSGEHEITYYYAEEKNGVVGTWKKDTKSLLYQDIDIKLHAKAVDLAGNETLIEEPVRIDMKAPLVSGVKDQSEYKQYYLPRFVSVSDTGSGVLSASYTIDGIVTPITNEVKITGVGTYLVNAVDNAGNAVELSFKIVAFPNLDEIDGSDESKAIIDQIQKELDENKGKLDKTEIDDTNDWLQDANEKWDNNRKNIIESEDKSSKVEGVGDTTFDPKIELVVDPLDQESLPTLPRKALYSYDVYLKKGSTVVQPNGSIKVYLPYTDSEAPIIYEIDEDGNVREITATKEGQFVVFTTNTLRKYAISNEKQEIIDDGKISVPGADGKLDTSDDVTANPSDKGEKPTKNPDGSVTVPPGGSVTYPDGSVVETPDGGILSPDGSLTLPDGTIIDPSGKPKPKPEDPEDPKEPEEKDEITVPGPDGKLDSADDVIARPNEKGDKPTQNEDGSVTLPNGGSVKYPNGVIVETPNGGTLYPDGSLKLPNGSEYDANGKRKPRVCSIKDGVLLNIDTDGDGLPDINLDIDDDCKADINIDLDGDQIPDIDIDTNGDGKADINIDVNEDGTPDLNLLKLAKWAPDTNYNYQGFTYDTMSGLKGDSNIDTDGDGNTVQGSGNNGNNGGVGGSTGNKVSGAYTGDSSKWVVWWMTLLVTISTMGYQLFKKRRRNH